MAIAQLQMADANKRLSSSREISFVANKSLLQELATQSIQEEQQGARSIRRLIQQMVENPLSDAILSGDIVDGDKLTLSWRQPDGLQNYQADQKYSKKMSTSFLNDCIILGQGKAGDALRRSLLITHRRISGLISQSIQSDVDGIPVFKNLEEWATAH